MSARRRRGQRGLPLEHLAGREQLRDVREKEHRHDEERFDPPRAEDQVAERVTPEVLPEASTAELAAPRLLEARHQQPDVHHELRGADRPDRLALVARPVHLSLTQVRHLSLTSSWCPSIRGPSCPLPSRAPLPSAPLPSPG